MYILGFSEDKLWCFAQNLAGITFLTYDENFEINIALVNIEI